MLFKETAFSDIAVAQAFYPALFLLKAKLYLREWFYCTLYNGNSGFSAVFCQNNPQILHFVQKRNAIEKRDYS